MVVRKAEKEYFRKDMVRDPLDGGDCITSGSNLLSTHLLRSEEVREPWSYPVLHERDNVCENFVNSIVGSDLFPEQGERMLRRFAVVLGNVLNSRGSC